MTNRATPELYSDYQSHMRKVADVRFSSALLQWDQETYLPPKGAVIRAQQIATLSEIGHELFIDEQLGNVLQELLSRGDISSVQKRNTELSWEDYTRQKKFTPAFVRELSETVSRSFHSWIDARKANDFSLFAPDLSKLIELKIKEADILGYVGHPYNALLNDHDKGSNVILLDEVFGNIRASLKDLLDNIGSRPQVDDSFLFLHYPKDRQWELGLRLLKELGYDFEAGRQDISEHPFTVNFNSQDVRITTRINENDIASMVWSCIHELGHALYEQGLPESEYGLPSGEPASYSIHESQSRLWENHIGRSRVFCKRYFPLFREFFPAQLGDVDVEEFYAAINKVQPSPIRTEADEATYHFHVMIRYELEKKLLERTIRTGDIPAYWNQHYSDYLRIVIPDDKTGCLQDVHWSHGSFGYFPTYSLGSFYAAQFFDTAKNQISIEENIRNGETGTLIKWLGENVYVHGRLLTSEKVCEAITGKTLDTTYFMRYLVEKYSDIYKF